MIPAQAALDWIRRGYYPIPVPFRDKKPILEAWQKLRIDESQVRSYFDGKPQNVGVLLGDERGSADIDCDCLEAVAAAKELAPATSLVFGRASKPASHYFYRSSTPVRYRKFTDPTDKKKTLVELRAEASSGSVGLQTVVPPSFHPTGEQVRFEEGRDGEPGKVEDSVLIFSASKIAAASLLARYWPKEGSRHEAFLALAGILKRADWHINDAISFHRAIYRALWSADPDFHGCSKEVESTFERRARGGETTGWTTLAGLIDPIILRAAMTWIGVPAFSASTSVPPTNIPERAVSKESQATKLVKLVSDLEYFRSSDGQPYVTLLVNDHQETYPLRSKGFRVYLQRRYFDDLHGALSSKGLQDALGVLEGKATYEGRKHPVYCRVGEFEGNIYIDLGNWRWDAIEVTKEGWTITPRPPVKFRRARGLLPIPRPLRQSAPTTKFTELININSAGGDDLLVVAWLLAAMRAKGPFPILVLNSEHGSGKTTVSRALRHLLDPNEAPVRALPKDERDLMISAKNGWMIALDNVSHIPDWLSDALCRLSTGGGLATRELYTDEDEILFNVQRPVMMNGIEEIATRGDLLDRAIVIELPKIPANKRVTERAFWEVFEAHRPQILGNLLDVLAGALGNIGQVKLPGFPRMADFAEWIVAAEAGLGWPEGKFLEIYEGNREHAGEVALDASPVARHVIGMRNWRGTATALLIALEARAAEGEKRSPSWPKSARGLTNAIRRLEPLLRKSGVEVEFGRDTESRTRDRLITLKEVIPK